MSHVCDGRDLSCRRCAEVGRRLETVRVAMTSDDELDDIKRARIWAQVEGKLAAATPRRPRWRVVVGVAAIAATAAAIGLVAWSPRSAGAPRLLSIPADTTVSSHLGPHARTALVGPAELELLGAPGDATAVRLRRGTLLAEFSGGPSRALRIEAPDAVVEVVGTLFAVEVRDTTCTSVARGRVRVTSSAGVVHVAAGERHCVGEPVRPIADDMRAALERHRVEITARGPSESSPVSSVAPASDPPQILRSQAEPSAETQPAAMPTTTPTTTPATPAPPERESPPAPDSPLVPAPPATARVPAVTASDRASAVEVTGAPRGHRAPATPEELYRVAEAALAARNPEVADRALATLIDEHPGSPLADQALYERARIAYQQRAWAAARQHLARLAALPATLLAEPGHYLACRIAVESGDKAAAACLAAYRKRFPRSPHDLEALALLVQLTHASADCRSAAALIDELVRTHPHSALATAWRARCPEVP
jgi:hypothetical protein